MGVFLGSTSSTSRVGFSTSVITDTQGPHSRLVLPPFTLEIKASLSFSSILGNGPHLPSFCSDLTMVALKPQPHRTCHSPDRTLRRQRALRQCWEVSRRGSAFNGVPSAHWEPSTALGFVGG